MIRFLLPTGFSTLALSGMLLTGPGLRALYEPELILWDNNYFGERAVPEAFGPVTQVSTYRNHALYLIEPGMVRLQGRRENGATVLPEALYDADDVRSVTVGVRSNFAIHADGTLTHFPERPGGNISTIPEAVEESPIEAVAASANIAAALTADGAVIVWGSILDANAVPEDLAVIEQVAVGLEFAAVLQTGGSVRVWGSHSDVAAVPDDLGTVTAISAGESYLMALQSDGTVRIWGEDSPAVSGIPDSLSGVVAISAGRDHCLALLDDGTVVAWGDNSDGQTTVPEGLAGVTAIEAGDDTSIALFADGSFRGWGDRTYNLFGQPEDLGDAIEFQAGNFFNAIIRRDGSIHLWGRNDNGQCDPPADLGPVEAISLGDSHVLALLQDGTVAAWGRNISGQAEVPENLANIVQVAASSNRSAVLDADGNVVEWGATTGLDLIPRPDPLEAVERIYANWFDGIFALMADGTMRAWGANSQGQLDVPDGLADIADIAPGAFHTVALRSDGTVVGWAPSVELGQVAFPEDVQGRIQAVHSGLFQTYLTLEDGTIRGFGSTGGGPPTIPDNLSRIISLSAGREHGGALVKARFDFNEWIADEAVDPEERGQLDDPNQDGVPNLLAYALGMRANQYDPTLIPRFEFDGTMATIRVRWPDYLLGASLLLERTTNYVDWETVVDETPAEPGDGFFVKIFELPDATPQDRYRVRVLDTAR